jgi:NADH-quinone oxidoreductase subunit M
MTSSAVLNLVVYLPLLAAVLLAFLPREQHDWIKKTALAAGVFTFFLSLALIPEFRPGAGDYDFLTAVPWIPQFGIQYKTGVDGISLVMVVLTTLLSWIAILSSFDAVRERVKEYYICLLLLETGMLGVFVALDLLLFYVFWEAMLIPMYFLIGIWGGPRRMYATIKFVLYTLVGSLLMLVAIVWVYVASAQAGQGTFDLTVLAGSTSPLSTSSVLSADARMWLFLAFASAFAIKVPMFPFHTWLPDAHVEAPTAGSVILAGVLLKMGTYGFLRFCIPLFPDVAVRLAPWFLVLAVIGIIYGALMAYVQEDVKRLVAYSSVSHLGFCVLGLFAFTEEGIAGSVLQMVNHGLSTGALFLLVGMIYERRHTREIKQFGGLWKVMPVFTAIFLITTLSSIGLPGLNGFVGEFTILLGTWGPPGTSALQRWCAILGATGVILGAVYMLWMFQRMMQGPLDNRENQRLKDLNAREIITLAPLVLLMFWIGVQPNRVLDVFGPAVAQNVMRPIVERGRTPALPSPPGGGLSIPAEITPPPAARRRPRRRRPPGRRSGAR